MAPHANDEMSEYPSLLRSDAMSKVQLYIPSEVAHATVEELAEMKRIQFIDLNSDVNPFQRTYVGQLRRLDEADRRLNFLLGKIEADGITVRPYADTKHLLQGRSLPQLVDELDPVLAEHEERVAQMSDNHELLLKRMAELQEARHVLRETASFFREAARSGGDFAGVRTSFSGDEDRAPLLENASDANAHSNGGDGNALQQFELEFVAGTIDRARMATFERVLWRVLRGNLYMNWGKSTAFSL